MKVGAIYATDVSNSFYRAVLPLQELERRGHTTVAAEVRERQALRVAPAARLRRRADLPPHGSRWCSRRSKSSGHAGSGSSGTTTTIRG